MGAMMKFTASGDALIMRNFPGGYEGYQEVKEFLNLGDARITNLETTLTDRSCFPSTFSGGTWLTAPESVLDDLVELGFNLYSVANNHMLDYSYGGLLQTLEAMKKRGLHYAGAGENLARASEPAIVDLPSGRVAFIAVTSTFDDTARAGIQGPYLPGRPGVNFLRHKEIFYVNSSHMQQLKEIADATDLNVKNKRRFKTGYKLRAADGTFELKDLQFKESETEGKETKANGKDLERIKREILNAKQLADYVVVMIHSHEMKTDRMEDVPDFVAESAHEFIDAGACMVLGGGTHQLKAVEIYQGKPIFYSLGNFVYQNEFVGILPPEFMDKYHLSYDTTAMEALAARRSHAKNKGMQSRENYLSVIPYVEMEGDCVKEIRLMPISLGPDKGKSFRAIPYPADEEEKQEIFRVLTDLSAEYGTRFEMDSEGMIRILI